MNKLAAFYRGIKEFRQNITSHYDRPLIYAYDMGREVAHILTFRYYEDK